MLTNDHILQVFIPFVDKTREKGQKVLLLLDGHSSHESLETIELAAANGVEIFALPPHMTHILQPMNMGSFSSIKLNWNKAQEEHCQDKNTKNQLVTREEAGLPEIRNFFK